MIKELFSIPNKEPENDNWINKPEISNYIDTNEIRTQEEMSNNKKETSKIAGKKGEKNG